MSDSSAAKTTLLDWVLRYLRLGWPVIPLRGKIPIVPNGSKDATLNPDQAKAWWAKWPDANIGVATGHRFFALDVDIKRGGEESFEHLFHQHGPWPDTIQQITGTGGKHLLFRLPDFPVRNSTDFIAPGIDIRGVGGYIVVAPSIHPETKRRYQWDGLKPIEEQEILPAPAWLLDKLRAETRRPVTATKPVSAAIPEGNRNQQMFKLACSLRRKGLAAPEILATLQASNRLRCQPPLSVDELETIAQSAERYAPDARGNVFINGSGKPASPEAPIQPADVEAAIDDAIARKDVVGAMRLAPEVGRLRPQFRAVIKAKLKQGFGREFPESLSREFDRALEDRDGTDQKRPPADPPPREEAPSDAPNLLPYPMTDSGNAERLVVLYGHEIRFCVEMKKWLVWDGKRWAVDEINVMRQKAKQMARLLYLQSLRLEREDLKTAMEKFARNSESCAMISNMLTLAAAEANIPISALALDQQPYLLNCQNGVIDLREGKLLAHNREFLITKLCPVSYQPHAECPQFQRFLEWAMGGNPDAELTETTVRLVGFLQRALGYGLTADVSEKAVFVFYGSNGNNGKTTLLTLYREMLGRDYANLLLIETIMAAKPTDTTARADLADLRGARFVATSEVGKEDRLNEQRVKYLTQGMGWIKSRRLYENPLEFEATHKLYMDCNYRPQVKGGDKAIWRRLKLVPFEVTISEDQKDTRLPDKLRKELAGILAWTVRGAMAWMKEGLGDPPEVSQAGEEWREHDDPLKEFLEDCCESGESLYVSIAEVMAAYHWWAKKHGERFPLSRQAFNERMQTSGFRQNRRRIDGKPVRIWDGIQLTAEVVAVLRRQSDSTPPYLAE